MHALRCIRTRRPGPSRSAGTAPALDTQPSPRRAWRGGSQMANPKTKCSRRALVAGAAGAGLSGIAMAQKATTREELTKLPPYGNGTIGAGIRSRLIDNVNGMTVHILEAGYETP